MTSYPYEVDHNPIKDSGLPNDPKGIDTRKINTLVPNGKRASCYVGYGIDSFFIGPVWVVNLKDKQGSPDFTFEMEDLVYEQAINKYLDLSDGNWYIPGADACGQGFDTISANPHYTLIGSKNADTGRISIGLFGSQGIRDGADELLGEAPLKDDLDLFGDDLAVSSFTIVINRQTTYPLENFCCFFIKNGRLSYSFGVIDITANPVISMGSIMRLEAQVGGDDRQEIPCETLSASINSHGQAIIVYRYFFHLYAIRVDDLFRSDTIDNAVKYDLIDEDDSPITASTAAVTTLDVLNPNDAAYPFLLVRMLRDTPQSDEKSEEIFTSYCSFPADGEICVNDWEGTATGDSPAIASCGNYVVLCVSQGDDADTKLACYSQVVDSSTTHWNDPAAYVDKHDATATPKNPAICLYENDEGGTDGVEVHEIDAGRDTWILYYRAYSRNDDKFGAVHEYKKVGRRYDLANFYRRETTDKRTWKEYRTIPGNHTFDMMICESGPMECMYAAIGNKGMCIVNYTADPNDPPAEFGKSERGWTTALLDGQPSNTWATSLFYYQNGICGLGAQDKPNYIYYGIPSQTDCFESTQDSIFGNNSKFLSVGESALCIDRQTMYALRGNAHAGKLTKQALTIGADTQAVDMVLTGSRVFVLKTTDEFPEVYWTDVQSINQGVYDDWTPLGSDRNLWHDNKFSAAPSALAVVEDKDDSNSCKIIIGCNDGSIWIDLGRM